MSTINKNKTIALDILYIKQKKICVLCRSKYNNKCKKQVILLMINDGEKYHYIAVTNLSALLQKNIIKSQRRFLLFKLL